MNHGFKLHTDGTLEITMPKGVKVTRVLVCEEGTQDGRLYYPESDVPDTNVGAMIDCTDCIKNGGDWECDRMHCHKGTKQQATKASDLVNREDTIRAITGYVGAIDKSVAKRLLIEMPSAEPEPLTEIIEEILDYLNTTLHPIISPDNWNVYSELYNMVSNLPSVEPEIIRCKDCKHWQEGTVFAYCDKLYEMGAMDAYDYMTTEDDFCSYAELRGEQND